MIRRYDIDLPKEIDERLKKVLAEVKKRSLLPEHTTERDFLLGTIFTNGLAAVEADLIKKDRESRSVLLPEELPRVPSEPVSHMDRPAMGGPPFNPTVQRQRTYHRKNG